MLIISTYKKYYFAFYGELLILPQLVVFYPYEAVNRR
ncbi:hypothetical protein FH603_3798 [Spirosoma sp. LMG 31447]|uniref:Uncharacterized protein n=1 Tax=Spirosoma utsteinense TaxID=2585773 RepID=A0ABR6W9M6_9BACT|nr:hypothetical protein [Spirosoma utsteinense]